MTMYHAVQSHWNYYRETEHYFGAQTYMHLKILFTLFDTEWKPRCDHKYVDRLRMQSNYAMQPWQVW